MQERYPLILQRLEAARRERGRTQDEVAQHLGISGAQYSRLESGVSEMTVIQLLAACNALWLEPSDVVARRGGKKSDEIEALRGTVATYEKHLGALSKALKKKDAWE